LILLLPPLFELEALLLIPSFLAIGLFTTEPLIVGVEKTTEGIIGSVLF